MNPEQIESTVKDVLVHCLHVEPETLTAATTWDDLKADSLARIEVTLALEDAFKLIIPDEEAMKFKTFADVLSFIQANAPAAASPQASAAR